MTIKQLVQEYQEIKLLLDQRQHIANDQTRLFAKTVKIMEELGEFCQEVITSQNLHRNEKNKNYQKVDLEAEFADVIGTLMLIAEELDIDVEKAIESKIKETKKRLYFHSEN